MRRLWLGLALVLVLLSIGGSVVEARIFTCRHPRNGPCKGTDRRDGIVGTRLSDRIYGLNGADLISGDPGANDGADDKIYGGYGNDQLEDLTDADDRDVISGGPGNDLIRVDDGPLGPDTVFCGKGDDTVWFDFGVDDIADDCENHVTVVP